MSIDVEAAVPVAADEVLRLLGDPLRWRIAELLSTEELCVCHLVAELGVPQPLVSHHLRALRRAGLVESERFRYWTYYRLRRDALAHIADRLASLATGPSRGRRPCS